MSSRLAIAELNVVKGTKSGTNEFHGSLFANNQTENLNARNQFLTTKAPLAFNQFGQFGGSLEGPLIRNKLLLFGVYEGYLYRQVGRVSGNGNLPAPAPLPPARSA